MDGHYAMGEWTGLQTLHMGKGDGHYTRGDGHYTLYSIQGGQTLQKEGNRHYEGPETMEGKGRVKQ